MSEFKNVVVHKKANIYFDGKCVSHTVVLPDGTKKSVGVILPSKLVFNTAAPEVMELVEGHCKVRLAGEDGGLGASQEFRGGQSFSVGAQSSFEIETLETLHYVCHFG